jgi:hypothetical protein
MAAGARGDMGEVAAAAAGRLRSGMVGRAIAFFLWRSKSGIFSLIGGRDV